MIIGFSLGCCRHIITPTKLYNKDFWISWYRQNIINIGDFNAIEIQLSADDETMFYLSKDNYEWLSTFKHISFHLSQITDTTMECIQMLPFVTCFVCHVDNKKILTEDFLKKYGHKIVIENIEDDAFRFLPRDNICFDIAHALSFGIDYTNTFYSSYRRNIVMLHLSNYDKALKHVPFYKHEDTLRAIYFKMKNYPIIIEATFTTVQEMKQELAFLKRRIG